MRLIKKKVVSESDWCTAHTHTHRQTHLIIILIYIYYKKKVNYDRSVNYWCELPCYTTN